MTSEKCWRITAIAMISVATNEKMFYIGMLFIGTCCVSILRNDNNIKIKWNEEGKKNRPKNGIDVSVKCMLVSITTNCEKKQKIMEFCTLPTWHSM